MNDYTLEDGPVSPTGQFKWSYYVTDSALSVTNTEKLAAFCLSWPIWLSITQGTGQLVQLVSLNKVLIVSMSQTVL